MNQTQKINFYYRFKKFQQNREKAFAPKINRALRNQYLSFTNSIRTQGLESALQNVQSAELSIILKKLYIDAGITYGAKIRADLRPFMKKSFLNPPVGAAGPKGYHSHSTSNSGSPDKGNELKARMPMGFSEQMLQLIEAYFRTDILNTSEGITGTTRDLIRTLFTDAYELGLSIDEIVDKLEHTELSRVRARMIARTETVLASNQGAAFAAKTLNIPLNKEWISAVDNRTRRHHLAVNGQVIDSDAYFKVGGYNLKFPGDKGGKEGQLPVDPAETINCRCAAAFLPKD